MTTEEGQGLAKEFNCPFFETSAALRLNVDEIYHEIVRCIQKKELRDYNEKEGTSIQTNSKNTSNRSGGILCCSRPQTDS